MRPWGQGELMDMELSIGQMMAIWVVWGDHGGIAGALRGSWNSGPRGDVLGIDGKLQRRGKRRVCR